VSTRGGKEVSRGTPSGLGKVLRELVLPIAVALALAFVVQATAAKPYKIPTGSMYPTIKPNDRIIANRLIYHVRSIHRGDIVVFDPTSSARATCPEEGLGNAPFVKRVIGVGGDLVQVRQNGPTLVNGRPLEVHDAGPNPVSASWRVPKGQLLLLGDNRAESCDAHLWKPDPFVPESNVIGQAEVIYWPPSDWGFLN